MDKKIIGIELGSTRIKAVLIDEKATVLAQGSHEWENRYENGYWTYSLDEVWQGLEDSFKKLNEDYKLHFGEYITEVAAIGISAMMHGYLAFDKEDKLLAPFRTWRNTTTQEAAEELSELLSFNIPQRWSVSHYYQAVLNNEEHVDKVAFLTTLSGYVHYKLTGKKVIGVGDASGMFPVENNTYDAAMLEKFNAVLKEKGINTPFESLLPEVLTAGENAGILSEEGARLLDPSGNLKAGAVVCPPEGDAGTGMVATNSITPKTANVSAGTSGFLMAVMEKNLKKHYPEIDVVTTPAGKPVAMVHVNNFTCEINAWADLFDELLNMMGCNVSKGELFDKLFKKSLESDQNTGKLVGYNFLSGEPIAGIEKGRPLFLRLPEGKMKLANFMQMQIYSALGSLAIGMDILKKENVEISTVCGHGGFFKTEFVGQNAMSAAVGAPVKVMSNAGEGGAWGMAILALFTLNSNTSLTCFLDEIFESAEATVVTADDEEKAKFEGFISMYKEGLAVEKAASECF